MKSDEIRQLFLDFFKERGHSIEKPAPLIPENDPSLLFTGAGMNQFKDLFFGKKKSFPETAATCQRCFRATDIENAGRTSRHLTFLEMLGNFSFGGYFKERAIALAWEFLSSNLRIPEEAMLITVFEEDEETFKIWNEKMGVPEERIFRMGPEDNFWEMGRTGPCGPCSEIIIDRGEKLGCGKSSCGPACDCDRHMELWNLVFTQYNRTEEGTLEALSQKNIDTGMGLERAACIIQGTESVFETDLLKPLVLEAEALSSASDPAALRIAADHARSSVFLIADGVLPSNEGRGYVLRKLIRRILEKTRGETAGESIFRGLVDRVCGLMEDYYPYLSGQSGEITHILEAEEKKFEEVFGRLSEVRQRIEELKSAGGKILPGDQYFMFYDTFGLPREAVKKQAEEAGLKADEEGFEKEMKKQRERSRQSSRFKAAGGSYSPPPGAATVFTGYSEHETSSLVSAVIAGGMEKDSAGEGEECGLITERTPFYPESGGQAGDRGVIKGEGWLFKAADTQKADGVIIHYGRTEKGAVRKNDACVLSIDSRARSLSAANHTATHLLQGALKKILGEHVRQAGSFVNPDGLRFDFCHPARMTREEIEKTEDIVNEIIRENIPVRAKSMPLEEALKAGAASLPGEKYAETARVVESGPYSMELCGGTHASATGDIGVFIIKSESSIASGVRRIEALTGPAALEFIREERTLLRKTAGILKTSPAETPERAEALLEAGKKLEKQISGKEGGGPGTDKIIKKSEDFGGIPLIIHREEGAPPKKLEALADEIRKAMGSVLCVLASTENGKVHIVASATEDIVARGIDAGKIARETAARLDGGGGGRPDFAKAGGKNPEGLEEALGHVREIVSRQAESR